MREAGNDAHGNHIAGGCCDDWDYRCRTVGCINSRCVGHYDIDVEGNQLRREARKPILMSVRKAKVDAKVPAFRVAEITKPGSKCVAELVGRGETKVPDPGKALRLLRLSRKRPRPRGAEQRD